jgi:DNA-binding ferritin-like protein (Dps family)
MRRRIHKFLNGKGKSKKTKEMIGCDLDFFKEYIEQRFNENMNWDNYGTYWHLDHYIPLTYANQFEGEEFERVLCLLNNYQNLKPMEAMANISKSDKLPKDYKTVLKLIKAS